jgi:hypothetical protein
LKSIGGESSPRKEDVQTMRDALVKGDALSSGSRALVWEDQRAISKTAACDVY